MNALAQKYLTDIKEIDVMAELRKLKAKCTIYEIKISFSIEIVWVFNNTLMAAIYPSRNSIAINMDNKFLVENVDTIKTLLNMGSVSAREFISFEEFERLIKHDEVQILNITYATN